MEKLSQLIDAVTNNQIVVVTQLIEEGVEVFEDNEKGNAPIHFAVESGNYQMVELLVKHGAIINMESPEYGYPIMTAIKKGHIDILKVLLDNEEDVDLWDDKEGYESPLAAAIHLDLGEIVKLLFESKYKISDSVQDDLTPFLLAVKLGNTSFMEYFYEKGAEINTKEDDANAPLYIAIENQRVPAVEWLLNHGAELHYYNEMQGPNPYESALVTENLEILKLIFDHTSSISTDMSTEFVVFALENDMKDVADLIVKELKHKETR